MAPLYHSLRSGDGENDIHVDSGDGTRSSLDTLAPKRRGVQLGVRRCGSGTERHGYDVYNLCHVPTYLALISPRFIIVPETQLGILVRCELNAWRD